MESKSILLQASTSFPIAVDSLHRDLTSATSEGIIAIDRYDSRFGAAIRYMDQVVGKLVDLGANRGEAIFQQESIWSVNAWGNNEIFDMSILVVTALASRFSFPRDASNPEKGDWHFADVAIALQFWARVPQEGDSILFSKSE